MMEEYSFKFAGKVQKPNFSKLRLDLKGVYYISRIIKKAKLRPRNKEKLPSCEQFDIFQQTHRENSSS